MSEHPIDVLAKSVRVCPKHGMPDCSPLLNGCSRVNQAHAALRAVEQLEQAAREHYDEWAAVNPPDLLPLPIQRIGAALALFDRKEQTP